MSCLLVGSMNNTIIAEYWQTNTIQNNHSTIFKIEAFLHLESVRPSVRPYETDSFVLLIQAG